MIRKKWIIGLILIVILLFLTFGLFTKYGKAIAPTLTGGGESSGIKNQHCDSGYAIQGFANGVADCEVAGTPANVLTSPLDLTDWTKVSGVPAGAVSTTTDEIISGSKQLTGITNLSMGHLLIPYVASDEDCTAYTAPAFPIWRNSDGLIGYCKGNTANDKVIIDNDTQTRCASFEKLAAADDHMFLASWDVDVTVVSYYCHYNKAAQATPATLQLTQYDQSTVLTQSGSPTCIADTAGAATAQAVTANNVIPARTPLEVDVTNTPSADGVATYEICVNWHY